MIRYSQLFLSLEGRKWYWVVSAHHLLTYIYPFLTTKVANDRYLCSIIFRKFYTVKMSWAKCLCHIGQLRKFQTSSKNGQHWYFASRFQHRVSTYFSMFATRTWSDLSVKNHLTGKYQTFAKTSLKNFTCSFKCNLET